jgi:hypothetical protein
MAANIITMEDLIQFREDLIREINEIIDRKVTPLAKTEPEREWIKSHQVQRLLGISPGTLQNLRVNGTLPFSKFGGVLFYDRKDVMRILEENMRNTDL